MQPDLPSFNLLLGQARAGSDLATKELVERFTPYLQRVIRKRLDKRLRTVFDSADFSQAVWASFFARPPQQNDFQEPEDLVRFLEQVARNKVVEQVRRRLGTRDRRVRREVPLQSGRSLIGPSPTASQEALAKERWSQVLDAEPPHHQEIMNSFRGGLSPREIADQVGVSVKTVRRAIRRLRLGLE
jgi:RNA polymerase sigma factor (sigma-70 family)